jgi:hypothetical protein
LVVLTKRDLSKRFETSFLGEVVISVAVTAIVLIAVVWNLPDAEIRRSAIPTLTPLAASTGLEQVWSMYAPDPISRTEIVEVHVTMADGSDRPWTFQRDDYVGGPLFWYHWQKFKEQVIRLPGTREGLANWVVHQLTRPDENPVRVQIIFRAIGLPAPGQQTPPASSVETLYERSLDGSS